MGTEEVRALDGIDLDVPEGDYLAIMGPSGSGKSTLLNLLGCLDRSSGGSHEVNGIEVTKLSDNELSKVRGCLLYTSPSPRDMRRSRMPSSA